MCQYDDVFHRDCKWFVAWRKVEKFISGDHLEVFYFTCTVKTYNQNILN